MSGARFFQAGLLVLAVACAESGQVTTPGAEPEVGDARDQAEQVLVRGAYFPNVVVGGTLPAQADFRPQFPPVWESADPGTATVSSAGWVTGVGAGQVQIRVSVKPGSLTLASAEGTLEVVPPFANVVLGSVYSCGQTAALALYCWGANGTAQLGIATSPDTCAAPCAATPHRSFATPLFTQVALGYGMNCGLTGTGATFCWGNNQFGQLGSPTGNLATPIQVQGSVSLVQIGVGRLYGCGLDAGGAAYCWGIAWPSLGNLGASAPDLCSGLPCSLAPVPVGGNHVFTSLSVGQTHACGVTASGAAWCWGGNGSGALGNGTAGAINGGEQVPQLVVGGHQFASISAGEINTCGISTGGAAYCWGDNSEGQIGNGVISGTNVPVAVPTPVAGGHTFTSVRTGGAHACAMTAAGRAWCWGRNLQGQLGDGTTVTSGSPVAVARGLTFAQLEVRRGHSCGRTAGGSVYCWGQNFYGQLGIGQAAGYGFADEPTGVGGAP